MTNLLFEPSFGVLRGNVRTSSIARWKVRGILPICDNWTFFVSSYGWDVISRYWSKSALFRGGGSLWAQILGGRGRRPPTIVGIVVFLLRYSKDRMILPSFVWIGYQRVADGQTDRQNCCRYYSALHCKQCGRAVKTSTYYRPFLSCYNLIACIIIRHNRNVDHFNRS